MNTTAKLPRGVRNNNPGNIELGDPWQGLAPKQTDGRFAQFVSPAYGIRALARTLITYQDKYGIRTVTGAINRWAPPVENDTGAYVRQVQKAVGGDLIDAHDYASLRPMVEAIVRHENGQGPLKNANTWYNTATIDEGLRLAGVRKPATEVAAVPVTKETMAATAAGAAGVGQIAEVLPAVQAAMASADAHLSSGSWFRIALGVITIGVAAYIAYAQIKRKQAGEL